MSQSDSSSMFIEKTFRLFICGQPEEEDLVKVGGRSADCSGAILGAGTVN